MNKNIVKATYKMAAITIICSLAINGGHSAITIIQNKIALLQMQNNNSYYVINKLLNGAINIYDLCILATMICSFYMIIRNVNKGEKNESQES